MSHASTKAIGAEPLKEQASESRIKVLFVVVASCGVGLRLLHNLALMRIPLYAVPLGGNLAFLEAARSIAEGDLLPGNRPFVDNSPLYPYILALLYMVKGENFLVPRLAAILIEGFSLIVLMRLGRQRFGTFTALAAGILYAFYMPAVFFSCQLIYIPYVVFLLLLSVCWLYRSFSFRRFFITGLIYGLAVDLMPTLMLGAPFLAAVPIALRRDKKIMNSLALCIGVLTAIMPVSAANYLNSEKLVFLTLSGGHNFYIGHNPTAEPGYTLPGELLNDPEAIRGTTFDVMKRTAEHTEKRQFTDEEVPRYYFSRAISFIKNSPGSEGLLLLRKILAFCNDLELSTYGDPYFDMKLSAPLRYSLSFGVVFPLAVLGMLWSSIRREAPLFVPIVTALGTVLGFFFISRFRAAASPFLCLFAGYALTGIYQRIRARKTREVAGALVLVFSLIWISQIPLARHDSSNSWNKLGVIYKAQKRYDLAKASFEQAIKESPRTPWAYYNLAALYKEEGDFQREQLMQRYAEAVKGK